MKTNILNNVNFSTRMPQRGAGMIEVLVAMLLLAVGVLGYSALQVRAVEATTLAVTRSQAMVLLRGLAEEIRVNSTVQTGTGGYPSAIQSYANFTASTSAPANNCNTGGCSATQLATFDAYQSAKAAFNLGMTINMAVCPGVSTTVPQRQCLYAAWGKTTLANINPLPASPSATDCMSSAGVYQPQATCLMMEAY
ncbi:MAG: type IV pilus modification protein PilV [Aquirhabdus sp.]